MRGSGIYRIIWEKQDRLWYKLQSTFPSFSPHPSPRVEPHTFWLKIPHYTGALYIILTRHQRKPMRWWWRPDDEWWCCCFYCTWGPTGFSGGFSVKMYGGPPWGRVGRKLWKCWLKFVPESILFLSNNTVYAGSPHTFMYEMDTWWGIWNWAKIWEPPTPHYTPAPI